MDASDNLMPDVLFRVRYLVFSYSFTTTLEIWYVDAFATLPMSLSHRTSQIVPELFVNNASCFRKVFPLAMTYSVEPCNVTLPQTLATTFVPPFITSSTLVRPGLHVSVVGNSLMSKQTSDSWGSSSFVRLFIWISSLLVLHSF